MNNTYYRVYCGKNGKFYTYALLDKAMNIYLAMKEQNYRTYIIKIYNGKEEIIRDYGGN